MGETVKLKDIAESLGISVVTVSNALAGKQGVSDSLREKVVNKAEELGYEGPKHEEGQETGLVIGVIVSGRYINVGASFYWAMYQRVVYEASRKQRLSVLEIIDSDKEKKEEIPELIRDKSVGGLIVIGMLEDSYMKKIYDAAEIPMVLLDFNCSQLKCDAVLSNNYLGMYRMTRYLLEHGHRNIGFIGAAQSNDNLCDRYFGYRKGIAEWDVPENPDWVINNPEVIDGRIDLEQMGTLPTAFVCSSDLIAGYLYDELKQKGYRVPEDVSIVGYDDYLHAHPFAGKLTTYHVNMKGMAQQAIQVLQKKMRGDTRYSGVTYLDSRIEERSSVKILK